MCVCVGGLTVPNAMVEQQPLQQLLLVLWLYVLFGGFEGIDQDQEERPQGLRAVGWRLRS